MIGFGAWWEVFRKTAASSLDPEKCENEPYCAWRNSFFARRRTAASTVVAMEFTNPNARHDLTYSDVFLVPSRSAVTSRFDVDLSAPDGSGMTIPLVSANMNSVTGPRLAAAIARRGGLGVLPQDLSIDDTLAAVAWVKAQSPTWDAPFELDEDATVAEALSVVPPIAGVNILTGLASSTPEPSNTHRATPRSPSSRRPAGLQWMPRSSIAAARHSMRYLKLVWRVLQWCQMDGWSVRSPGRVPCATPSIARHSMPPVGYEWLLPSG